MPANISVFEMQIGALRRCNNSGLCKYAKIATMMWMSARARSPASVCVHVRVAVKAVSQKIIITCMQTATGKTKPKTLCSRTNDVRCITDKRLNDNLFIFIMPSATQHIAPKIRWPFVRCGAQKTQQQQQSVRDIARAAADGENSTPASKI